MHACGHDGHTAIGLGVAEVRMQVKDQTAGKLKLILPPGVPPGDGRAVRQHLARGRGLAVQHKARCHLPRRHRPCDHGSLRHLPSQRRRFERQRRGLPGRNGAQYHPGPRVHDGGRYDHRRERSRAVVRGRCGSSRRQRGAVSPARQRVLPRLAMVETAIRWSGSRECLTPSASPVARRPTTPICTATLLCPPCLGVRGCLHR